MKKIFATGLCVSIMVLGSNVFAFEMPSAIKGAASAATGISSSLTPTSARSSITTINNKLSAADFTLQNAFNSLVAALSSTEKATEIKSKVDAIKSNKDLSKAEQSAKIAQIISDYGTALQEEQATLAEQLKNTNEEKRTEVANAISSVVLVSYQYLNIANDCKSLTTSISANPTLAIGLAPELKNLKDMGVMLKNNILSLKNVTTQAVTVAKASGINVNIPKNEAGKAKQVDLSDIN